VVVMDNLWAHQGERVSQLIERRGCELLYLPSYSPDLYPIGEAFGQIKASRARPRRKTERPY
jgi:transposase